MTLFTLLLTCAITAGAPSPDVWRWPLGPPAPQVLRGFSPPASPWGPGHRGVDLAARPGQAVRAAGPGRVSFADRLAGRGVVAITHGRLSTTYLPVRPSVPVGHRVAPGTVIGRVEAGRSHCTATCLHWGLRDGNVYLNPVDLLRRQIRLLPYWSPPPAPRERDESAPAEPRMGLRDATTATGGALTGLVLAYALAFAWRRTRPHPRARLRTGRLRPPPPTPPGVIDLSKERRLRRTP